MTNINFFYEKNLVLKMSGKYGNIIANQRENNLRRTRKIQIVKKNNNNNLNLYQIVFSSKYKHIKKNLFKNILSK